MPGLLLDLLLFDLPFDLPDRDALAS